jgi:hypothetical protein
MPKISYDELRKDPHKFQYRDALCLVERPLRRCLSELKEYRLLSHYITDVNEDYVRHKISTERTKEFINLKIDPGLRTNIIEEDTREDNIYNLPTYILALICGPSTSDNTTYMYN